MANIDSKLFLLYYFINNIFKIIIKITKCINYKKKFQNEHLKNLLIINLHGFSNFSNKTT